MRSRSNGMRDNSKSSKNRVSLCTKIYAFAPVVCSSWALMQACRVVRRLCCGRGSESPKNITRTNGRLPQSNVNVAVEVKVIVIGLDDSGKSSLLERWTLMGASGGSFADSSKALPSVQPTQGFAIKSVEWKRIRFNMWEIGGAEPLRKYWNHYAKKGDMAAVIYVVDCSSSYNDVCRAGNELRRFLDGMNCIPRAIAICANKQDVPGKMSYPALSSAIRSSALIGSHTHYRPENGDDLEELKDAVMEDMQKVMGNISTTGRGVYVQASTLGALEALLEFLRVSEIPVSGVQIGPVYKKDVVRASVMLEHKPEFATILAFDVKVDSNARAEAENLGVQIFTADIIYHLFDQFTAYMERIRQERREANEGVAVFPVILKTIKCFNTRDPLVLGCEVLEGILKVGTPLCVPDVKDADGTPLRIGTVTSVEQDYKEVNLVKPGGQPVAVKIEAVDTMPVTFGRQMQMKNLIFSYMSRKSIDALKENFKDALERKDWMTVVKIRDTLKIGKN